MKIDTEGKLNYLRNDTAVIVRRLRESDRKKLLDGFGALSQLSRYRRFLHNKNELKQSEIDCLFTTAERRGISFIVFLCNDTQTLEEGRCVGLIQLLELESPGACAEVALVVIDEFHNCGLGKILLGEIEKQAFKRKVQHLYFFTTSDNQPLIAILNRTGWDISIDRELGSVTYIAKVKQNRDFRPVDNSIKTHAPAHDYQAKLIHQGQLLTTSWFKVCLRMVIFMNQFNMNYFKGR